MGPIRRDRVKIHTLYNIVEGTSLWLPVIGVLHLPSRVAFRDSVREVEAEI